MGARRFIPLLVLIGAVTVAFVACNRDPWGYMNSPTDVVSITKTTKFAKDEQGLPLKSQVGTVRMSHKVHAEKGIPCETCHHKTNNDARIKKCASEGCHVGYNGYATIHNLCLNCHIEEKEGPTKCKNCH